MKFPFIRVLVPAAKMTMLLFGEWKERKLKLYRYVYIYMYINIYVCAHIYIRDFHILLNFRSSLFFIFNITTGILLEVSFFSCTLASLRFIGIRLLPLVGRHWCRKSGKCATKLGVYQILIFFPNLLASIYFLESSVTSPVFTAMCVCAC